MANFETAFDKTIKNEGGYLLHKVAGDSGGWTYAGIAENYWPNWEGWALVKSGREEETTAMVKRFYKENFWDKINGDKINSDVIAYHIYDFAVNAGVKVSAKIAQRIVDVMVDGIIGENSLKALNKMDEEIFELKFSIGRVSRYAGICNNNRSQSKFLLGWVNRTLNSLSV